MRALLLSTVAFAALAGSALASDLPSTKSAPVFTPAPVFSWTGFYLGAEGGVDFLDTKATANAPILNDFGSNQTAGLLGA